MRKESPKKPVALSQAIEAAFRKTARPAIVETLSFLGCCEEHRESFEVYRTMTPAAFEAALRTAPERFDPFEYMSLEPALTHYFAPALLRAAIASVEASWNQRSTIGEFVRSHLPLDDDHGNRMRAKLLPYFDEAQRAVMRHFFRWFFPAYNEALTPDEWARLAVTWG